MARWEQIEREIRRRNAQIRLIIRHLHRRPFYGRSRYNPDHEEIAVTPDLRKRGIWRVTWAIDGEAHGHSELGSFEEAVQVAVKEHGLDPETIVVDPASPVRRDRLHRRDPVTPEADAASALRHAEALERSHGPADADTLEAYAVAADAWEDAGNPNLASHLRLSKIMAVTGEGYGYGISPPHGIFTKGATMAYVRAMSAETGSPFFSRSTTRFFGPERHYGPYVGPGGVFFVTQNQGGIRLREVRPDWSIHTIGRVDAGLAGVREEAQARARADGFPTWTERARKRAEE